MGLGLRELEVGPKAHIFIVRCIVFTLIRNVTVIPSALASEMVDKALENDDLRDFQRKLPLERRSIYGVYPPNDEVREEFEKYKRENR